MFLKDKLYNSIHHEKYVYEYLFRLTRHLFAFFSV